MKSILEYLLSKNNKTVEDYSDFIEMLRINSKDKDDKLLDELSDTLNKIGKCNMLDITINSIMKFIETNKFEVFLEQKTNDLYTSMYSKYIQVFSGHYTCFLIVDLDNKEYHYIHVGINPENEYSDLCFRYVAVPAYDKKEFLDAFEKDYFNEIGIIVEDIDKDEDNKDVQYLKKAYTKMLNGVK